MVGLLVVGAAVLFALTGLLWISRRGGGEAASPVATPTGAVSSMAAAQATATETHWATLPPLPSVAEPTGPKLFPMGSPATVTLDGDPWAEITVSDASTKGYYRTTYGTVDRPAKGSIFIQAKFTYKALTDGVDYNPFDWQVFCDGQAFGDRTFVSNGPQPELHSGTLPNGRSVSGWLVFEVPAKGEVRVSYGGGYSRPPVFEVIIRKA